MSSLVVRMLGGDPAVFGLLLKTSLRMDFRSRRAGGRRILSPFARSLIGAGTISLLVALSVRESTPATFAMFMVSFVMLFSGLTVLKDYQRVVLDPTDAEVVGPRPVTERTYLLVRMAHLLFYLALTGFAQSLGPALVLASRGAEVFPFAGSFLMGSWLAALFAGASLVVVYALLIRLLDIERVNELLYLVSLILIMSFILGFRFLRTGAGGALEGDPGGWIAAPPVWFASIAMVGTGRAAPIHLALAGWGVAAVLFVIWLPLPVLTLRYAEYLGALRVQRRSRRRADWFRRLSLPARLLLPEGQRTVFEFLGKLSLRDRIFKIRTIPFVLLTVLFMLGAVVQQPGGGAAPGPGGWEYGIPLFILLACLNTANAMQHGRYEDAAWVFRVSPGVPGADVVRAWHAFVFLALTLPLLAIYGIIAAVVHGWGAETLWEVAGLFLLLDMAISIDLVLRVKDYPFARRVERGEVMFGLMGHLGLLVFFGALWYLYRTWRGSPLPLLGSWLLLAISLRVFRARVVGRRLERVPEPGRGT